MVSYTRISNIPSIGVLCNNQGKLGISGCGGQEWDSFSLVFENSILLIRVQGYRGLAVSIFEVLCFLTLLVYTAPQILVFCAVYLFNGIKLKYILPILYNVKKQECHKTAPEGYCLTLMAKTPVTLF